MVISRTIAITCDNLKTRLYIYIFTFPNILPYLTYLPFVKMYYIFYNYLMYELPFEQSEHFCNLKLFYFFWLFLFTFFFVRIHIYTGVTWFFFFISVDVLFLIYCTPWYLGQTFAQDKLWPLASGVLFIVLKSLNQ